MMDFAAALDTKAGEVVKPPVCPQGTYTWTVAKVPAISEITSAKGEWDVIEFQIRAVQADDDVDPEELDNFGNVSAAMSRVSFMFPKGADAEVDRQRTQNRLKRFLIDVLRLDDEGGEKTLKELLSESVNAQFKGRVKWRQVNDETYFDVVDHMPLD